MKTILEYLRLTLFLGGALIGVQIPSFVDQYGQRLESHLLESQTNMQAFQSDADKYFQGDIGKLIQHYAKNKDPVINDGGDSIASLHSRTQFLNRSWSDFNANIYQRYWHSFASPIKAIQSETWKGYDFIVRLDISGIVWALSFGFILSALIELCLTILKTLFSFNKRPITYRQKAPTLHTEK